MPNCSTDFKHPQAISLYDIHNIDELAESHKNEFLYYKPLLLNQVSHYIPNISGEINLLKIDHEVLPLLITSNNYSDSYVCSPYGNYISLALESLLLIKNKWLRHIAKPGLKSLGSLIKAGGINSAVYVNHSLLSTDLHPDDLTQTQILNAILFLKNKFPNHAIIFRSLNLKTCSGLKVALKSSGFKFIANRQIFLTETKNQELYKTRIIKSDLKAWNEKKHEAISLKDFTPEDEQQVLNLCRSLAIKNHSELNPQINCNFLKLMKECPGFQIKALKLDGKIEGVAGYHIKDKVLLCPILGYDKINPNGNYIYRLLSTMLLLEAAEHAEIFHQSAGASFYKTIRRATAHLEYQAFYTQHLPVKQRFAWHFLKSVINGLAIPFMKKY